MGVPFKGVIGVMKGYIKCVSEFSGRSFPNKGVPLKRITLCPGSMLGSLICRGTQLLGIFAGREAVELRAQGS